MFFRMRSLGIGSAWCGRLCGFLWSLRKCILLVGTYLPSFAVGISVGGVLTLPRVCLMCCGCKCPWFMTRGKRCTCLVGDLPAHDRPSLLNHDDERPDQRRRIGLPPEHRKGDMVPPQGTPSLVVYWSLNLSFVVFLCKSCSALCIL